MSKKFVYKIYNSSGTFIRALPVRLPVQPTVDDELVLNTPKLIRKINGGGSELVVNLDTKFDDFDEGISIDHGNILKLYLIDDNNPTGKILFNGVIESYRPYLTSKTQGVKIIALSRATELQQDFYTSSGNRIFQKAAIKASDLFKNIIDNFRTVYTNTNINYTGSSVEDSGVNITYDFDYDKHIEAIDAALDIAPSGWWWRIEPDGTATFKSKPSSSTHRIIAGKDANLNRVELDKTMEPIINNLFLKWSDATAQFQDATSQTAYGVRSVFIDKSSKITNTATRDEFGDSYIADNKDIKYRVKTPIIINDSFEYIEDIFPGDTINVLGFAVGGNPFIANMQVIKTVYNGTTIELIIGQDSLNFPTQINT